eukprot:scaffold440441_cov15-Prasinocladus_malaysianus.AAC.1
MELARQFNTTLEKYQAKQEERQAGRQMWPGREWNALIDIYEVGQDMYEVTDDLVHKSRRMTKKHELQK